MSDHSVPLAEPRTTSVSLRRRPVSDRLRWFAGNLRDATDRETAPLTMTSVAGALVRAADELDTPPTLRGLIRAARAAGLVLKRRRHSPTWTDWYAENDTLIVEVVNDDGWDITIRSTGIDVNLEGSAVTLDRIAAAARLCGWDLGSTT